MSGRPHLWMVGVALIVVMIYGTDWAISTARLDGIFLETTLEPSSVAADGKSSIVLTVQVTEHGQPRVNDLLQSWLDTGSGLLIPEWVYTDENGIAQITYTPNPLTKYDLQDKSEKLFEKSSGSATRLKNDFREVAISSICTSQFAPLVPFQP